MTLHIIDPFKRTTYLCSNESYPLAHSHWFVAPTFDWQTDRSLVTVTSLSYTHIQDPQWKITRRQRKVCCADFLCKGVSRMSPCVLTGLLLAPKVGQTAALRLSNRLGFPLYYCVLENTHTHTLSFQTELHTWTWTFCVHSQKGKQHEQAAQIFRSLRKKWLELFDFLCMRWYDKCNKYVQ